jgi:hypothetical protein
MMLGSMELKQLQRAGGSPANKVQIINGVAMERIDIQRSARGPLGTKGPTKAITARGVHRPAPPKFVSNCNEVLSFEGYFMEAVNESNDEATRVRKCKIQFYLESEQVEVTEIKQENSGMSQGQFLKKCKVPKQTGNNAPTAFVTASDLVVGQNLTIYGRVFHLVDCDKATREWCKKQSMPQPVSEPYPAATYEKLRAQVKVRDTGADQTVARGKQLHAQKRFMEASLGNASPRMRVGVQNDNLASFLANDRVVLRFFTAWDDRGNLNGDLHKYTLNYFLADGKMEILEARQDGRDNFPTFLKRTKQPKHHKPTIDGDGVNGIEEEQDHAIIFFTVKDLVIGQTINVNSREMLIYDADDTTYEWFIKNHAVDMRPNRCEPVVEVEQAPKREFPPWNGFGSEEDSLGNCTSLISKAPKKDFIKMLANEGKVLRFLAKMIPKNEKDLNATRSFVIRYYLSDDTVDVFEPPQRNSGMLGGKFMKRQEAKDPMSGARYYAWNIQAGSIVTLSGTPFLVEGMDEYTMKYMEQNPDAFPFADGNLCESELLKMLPHREAVETKFKERDTDGSGFIDFEEFKTALAEMSGNGMTPHQLLTIFRKYDQSRDNKVSLKEFMGGMFGQ